MSPSDNQREVIDWTLLFLYALAAVTGGAAGCALAAIFRLRGVKITKYIIMAYVSIAAFAGIIFVAFFIAHGWIRPTIEDTVIYGGISALIVLLVMSGTNITIRFSSKRWVDDTVQRFGTTITVDDPPKEEPPKQQKE